MKHIKYLFPLLLAVLVSGCVKEEKDIFDKPSLERLYELTEEYRELLVSAENGWIMDYYPEKNQSSGGYTMLVKFNKDGTASVACEIDTNIPAKDIATSDYEMTAELGVLVKFNTYNSVMHYFCDPSVSDVDGMAGDSEFIVFEADKDQIVLQGKKYYNTITLHRFEAGNSWDDYFDKVARMRYNSGAGRYDMTINGKTYSFVNNNNMFVYYYTDDEGVTQSESLPFVCTDTGIRLYSPEEWNGVLLYTFEYDEAADKLVSNESDVEIIFEYIDPNVTLLETQERWYFVASESHSSVQQVLNYRWTGSWSAYYVDAMSIGVPELAGYSSFGMSFNMYAVSRYYYGIWGLEPKAIGDDGKQITFGTPEGKLNQGNTSVGGAALTLVNAFEANDPYFVEFEDKKIPTKLILTSQNDPSVYFTIQK